MKEDHPYYDQIVKDTRYKNEPTTAEFPMFESLKLTIDRTLPYWNRVIVPQLQRRKRIIIAAHGNSLRGIIKYLDSKYVTNTYLESHSKSTLTKRKLKCIDN